MSTWVGRDHLGRFHRYGIWRDAAGVTCIEALDLHAPRRRYEVLDRVTRERCVVCPTRAKARELASRSEGIAWDSLKGRAA